MISVIMDVLGTLYGVVMDVAALALQYLKVLVWPTAVMALALIYRRPLVNLIGKIRKASGWGLSLETEANDLAIDAQIANASVPPSEAALAKDDPSPAAPATDSPAPKSQPDAPTPSGSSTVVDDYIRSHSLPTIMDELSHRRLTAAERDLLLSMQRQAPQAILEEGLSDASLQRMRRNRVEAAWITLNSAALNAGLAAGITASSLEAIVIGLMERQLLKVGQWRIASRLSNLYTTIKNEDEPISEKVAVDFTIAAKNLQAILSDATERVQRARRRDSGPDNGSTPDPQ